MRFIPTSIHGIIDYIVGIALIAAPWVLGFANGGPEQWTPVVVGVSVLVYSAMTAYELGMFPTISVGTHLMLDAIGGVFLATSPWVFGFSDYIWFPHVLVGLGEVFAAATTQLSPRRVSAGPGIG